MSDFRVGEMNKLKESLKNISYTLLALVITFGILGIMYNTISTFLSWGYTTPETSLARIAVSLEKIEKRLER